MSLSGPLPKSTTVWEHFRYNQPVGDMPVGRRCDLIVVAEIVYRLSTTPKVFLVLQPSMKLLEAFIKSGFAASRFPGLQILHSDEIFLADQP